MKITKILAASQKAQVLQPKNEEKNSTQQLLTTNPTLSQQDKNASAVFSNYFKASQAMNPSFVGYACSTSNFRPKQLESMPCACCGRPMMTNQQINDFVKEVCNVSGEELINVLTKNIDHFRSGERAVVNHVIKGAKDDPKASMSQIIRRSCPSALVLLQDEQKDVLSRISEKAKGSLGEKNPIENCVQRGLVSIMNDNALEPFKRKDFIEDLMKVSETLTDKELAAQLLDIAVQLPQSSKSINSFIVKYSRRSDEEIARRLVASAVVTAEHIHPKSKGGPNHTANYVGECQECNGNRGNMDLNSYWQDLYPNMPRSFQRNVDAVTEQIINGKVGSNYDDYPIDMKATIEKQSQGVIQIKVLNPEEIDKLREERGIAKPVSDPKELAEASGGYRGPKIEGNSASKGSGKKKRPKKGGRHIVAENIVKLPQQTQTKKA